MTYYLEKSPSVRKCHTCGEKIPADTPHLVLEFTSWRNPIITYYRYCEKCGDQVLTGDAEKLTRLKTRLKGA